MPPLPRKRPPPHLRTSMLDPFRELWASGFGRVCALLLGFFGVTGSWWFVMDAYGPKILLSQDYYSSVVPYAAFAAVALGVVLHFSVLFTIFKWDHLASFTYALIVGGCFFLTIMGTVPMFAAVVVSEPRERQVIVSNPSLGSKSCRRGIVVTEPPFFNQICGVDGAFRETLSKGQALWVEGIGSDWGFFPNSLSHVGHVSDASIDR